MPVETGPLTLGVAALVLLAAAFHATWNAMVKSGADKTVTLALAMAFSGVPAVLLLPFVPVPEPASWPYLVFSILDHWLYYFFLISAYRFGDLSLVYPIARGAAPALAALGAWALAGEALGGVEVVGVAVVSVGIMSLAWRRGIHLDGGLVPVGYALLTGVTIAAYSVADGLGARHTAEPFSYIAWLFALESFPVLLAVMWLRRGRIRQVFPPALARGAIGGLIAAAAYAIVIWAMSRGSIAHVVALRETSVILAALIGTVLLGESNARTRIAAAVVVATGTAILQLSG